MPILDFINILTTSDGLQFISLIIAFLSFIFTLRYNAKTLERSSRPYVEIYKDTIVTDNSENEYLIIKNFGNSPAYISDIIFDEKTIHRITKNGLSVIKMLNSLKLSILVSGQSYQIPIYTKNKKGNFIIFIIKYKLDTKKYCEKKKVYLKQWTID